MRMPFFYCLYFGMTPARFAPLLLVLFCAFAREAKPQDDWSFVQQKEEINLFLHKAPDGKLKTYKGYFVVQASLNACASALYNCEFHGFFMDGVAASELVKKPGERSLYFYHIIDLPWPVPNRDMVTHAEFEVFSDLKKVIVKLKSAPQEKEPSNLSRAVVPEREWHFAANSSGQTEVTYYYRSDPEKIPGFLEDIITINGPMNMMARFKKLVTERGQELPRLAWIAD